MLMAKPGNSLVILSPTVSQLASSGKVTVKGKFRGKRPIYLCGAVFQGNVVPDLVDSTRGKLLPGKKWQINFPAGDGAQKGENFIIIWALYKKEDPVERFGVFFAGPGKQEKLQLGANTIFILDPNGSVNVANNQVNADGEWNGNQPQSICGMIWNPNNGQPPPCPPALGTTAGMVNPNGTWTINNIPNVQCSHTGIMNCLVVWAVYGGTNCSMAGTGFGGFC
jgi:hypothetical protein